MNISLLAKNNLSANSLLQDCSSKNQRKITYYKVWIQQTLLFYHFLNLIMCDYAYFSFYEYQSAFYRNVHMYDCHMY